VKKLALVLLLIMLGVTGCFGGTTQTTALTPAKTLTISAKADTEGALLAQIIRLTLEHNGYQVNMKPPIAGTSLIRQALLSGDLDLYPEYTGNGAVFFPEVSADIWKDAQSGYEQVRSLDKQKNNIIWLQPAPANNTWAIAVPKALADKEKLVTLQDFGDYVKRGGYVKLAGSEEFITSDVALPAFQVAYGFTLTREQLVSLAGGNTAQTEKYAAEGTDGINACMAYGTDGSLSALNLVVLTDPKGVQPVYEPAPTVRGAVMEKHPSIETILNPVFASLTLTTLQELNAAIAINGQSPEIVARNYLTTNNFIK
jgi:osmoprotectant transport system substrate-binding protein